ncbi:Putative phosphoserine phosphatase 2 [Vibrio quintilis]|uniref:Putative phosphoserine phosphatase 2 n=2 Tax=Vibrio quintilis TaxID=1117707 RepID=A0A1M7YUV8_9VIBR|nr:Putative phosphoserine phosphatase 2 [Vibrio quintilis]
MILVRHGETGWNRQRRIQGWLDSPLTPEAVAQLKRLFSDNPSLAHIRPTVIYSSDSGRAHHSAQILAESCGADVITDARLRERRFGILEGKVIDQDNSLAACWRAYHHRYDEKMTAVSGVEPEQDFEQRIRSFLAELASRHSPAQERDIVIVSHGEWIRACLNVIHGVASWKQGNGVAGNAVPVDFDFSVSG